MWASSQNNLSNGPVNRQDSADHSEFGDPGQQPNQSQGQQQDFSATNQQAWNSNFYPLYPLFPSTMGQLPGVMSGFANGGLDPAVFGHQTFATQDRDSATMPNPSVNTNQPSPNSKLELDARAAELKEKLLKSRSQKDRLNSASPANDNSKPTMASQVMPRPPFGGSSGANRPGTKTPSSTFVPHPLPQETPQTSVHADDNDIAQLIESVVGNHTASTVASPNPSAGNKDGQQLQASATSTSAATPWAPFASASRLPLEKLAQKPQKSNLSHSVSNSTSATEQTTSRLLEEGEISKSPPPTMNETAAMDIDHKKTTEKTAVTRPRAPSRYSSGETQPTTRQQYSSTGRKDEPPETRPSTKNDDNQKRGPTTQPSRHGTGSRDEVQNSEAANRGSSKKPTDERDGSVRAKQNVNGETGNDSPTVGESLARLLERDADLRDWLVFTDWYNLDTRAKVLKEKRLERSRKTKEIDAQIERLMAQKQQLDGGIKPPVVPSEQNARSAIPGAASASSSKTDTPMISPRTTEQTGTTRAAPAKREYEDNDDKDHERIAKIPRVDDRRPRSNEGPPRGDPPRRGNSRMSPPGRNFSPNWSPRPPRPISPALGSPRYYPRTTPPPLRPREYSPDRSRPRAPSRMADEYEYRDRAYDSYRARPASDREPVPNRPQRGDNSDLSNIDLGRPGDSRFFIVKSFNEENVRRCMEDGVWTTQIQNGQILTEAFAKCKNAILFFSINKSRAFQGYARMASPPSPDTPRPKWMNAIHWDTTPPFRVDWLSKTTVEFFRIGHLKNSLNENAPVLVGKDGQEVEEECGRALLYEMRTFAEARRANMNANRDHAGGGHRSPNSPQRGRGAYRGRGGFRRQNVKREDDDGRW